MRAWQACLLLTLIVAACPDELLAEDQRAFLDLTINLVPKGTILVFLEPGDTWVRVADLEGAGLRDFSGRRQAISGEMYVSLASLASAITYELDEKVLALRLTAPPDLLEPTVVSLQTVRPSGITYTKDTVAFLNYSFHLQDLRRLSAFAETGLSVGGNLLFTTLSRNADGSWLRGLTNFTVDDREHLRRWIIGDSFAGGGSFGGALFLGGLSISRDFGLDPYFIPHPTLGFSTAILTPSTVDIYVNETLVRREPVPPGPFELRNLPVTNGRGAIRLVVRDAYGREHEITSSYYFSTRVLARGVSEYSYNLGFRREQGENTNWRYGPLAFLARHRHGLTDSITAGFVFQADGDLVMGGPSLTTRLPLGELELAAAASGAQGGNGAAASVAYSYLGPVVSFGVFVRGLTPRWATLSLTPESDRARVETNAFVGFHTGSRLNVSLQLASADFRDRPRTDRASVLSTIRLTSRASLSLSGGRLRERGRSATFEVSAGLTVSLGHNTTARFSQEQRGEQATSLVQVQKSLPAGVGYGYRVEAQRGDQSRFSGLFQYQGPFGRYEAGFQAAAGRNSSTLSISGGLVGVGRSLHFTRPIQESFALIRVPGLRGVQGYASNQPIGRTNARGDLLVPNLLSYYGNELSIEDQDLPLTYSIGSTEKLVAPPFRGGTVVLFPVQRIQDLTGEIVLVVSGQTVIPAYGQLTVSYGGKQTVSPLGKQGEFYLESLPAGNHSGEVEYADKRCRFQLSVPPTEEPLVDLGALQCMVL